MKSRLHLHGIVAAFSDSPLPLRSAGVALLTGMLFITSTLNGFGDETAARSVTKTSASGAVSEPTSTAITAVLFAPGRPVFLKLAVDVDGADLASFREQFAARWFARLDKDKDGTVSESEAAGFPTTTEAGRESPDRKIWPELDNNPADGKCAPAEFRSFLDRTLGPPLALTPRKVSGNTAAGLFDRIDINHDGTLAGDELSAARKTLERLDSDDDEAISIAELAAAEEIRANTGAQVSDESRLPLALVGFGSIAESVAGQLLRVYDARHKPPADGALDAAELGQSSDQLTPFDADKNGKLDESELVQLVSNAPPQSILHVHLFSQQRGGAKVAAETATSGDLAWKSTSDGISAELETFRIQFNAKRTRSSAGDSSSFFAVRFRVIDKDRNNYLDEKEFPKLDLDKAEFKEVDADGNNQLTVEELTEFISRREMAPLNEVTVEVADESRSLFDLLDTRTDGRLSPRELMSASNRLAEIDSNKDGRITPGELTTRVSVEFGVKRPAVDRGGIMAAMPRNTGGASVVSREEGPDWFLRMDRNYDGDVSFREFLGTRAVFDRLDLDHDGLLSSKEAEKAK